MEPMPQTISTIITDLQKRSAFTHTVFPDGRTLLKDDTDERFTLTAVTDLYSPLVHSAQVLLEQTFKASEVTSERSMRIALEQNARPDRPYDFFLDTITDSYNALVATIVAGYIPAQDEQGNGLGYGVLTVGYIAVLSPFRRRGMARELYALLYRQAERAAYVRGESVRLIVEEAVPTVEHILERLGHRARVYFQDAQQRWVEVRYVQPPLRWDQTSGQPTADAAATPEHLMLTVTDGSRTVSRDEVLAAIRAAYSVNNTLDIVYRVDPSGQLWTTPLPGPTASERSLNTIGDLYRSVRAQLDDVTELRLMTTEERAERMQRGEQFLEHTAADER
jgi:ribosomal protein S18 acetylase RimI-like enzyme